jgi:predicted dehydrogenase
MRRNAEKASDYAQRHGVPRWYDNADALINDSLVNAVYIATPPAAHLQYTLAALAAGKAVYVEKPMALNHAEAARMAGAASSSNGKLVVAHYRRQWPLFKKIHQLLQAGAIGQVRMIKLRYHQPLLTKSALAIEKIAWRVDPAIAGGGLFNDIAPHQLDILYHFFGNARLIQGIATNQAGIYAAPDAVVGSIHFNNNILFTGSWCFTGSEAVDDCIITGSEGSLQFSFFDSKPVKITVANNSSSFYFEPPQHVQQPMIEQVVQYFQHRAPNPCTAIEGAEIMRWIDLLTAK